MHFGEVRECRKVEGGKGASKEEEDEEMARGGTGVYLVSRVKTKKKKNEVQRQSAS